ncbi:hypothetical protein pdam_00013863, partial [Pocillopora damicornis]
MILRVTKRNPIDFNGYGCWCGIGGKGKPEDDLDRKVVGETGKKAVLQRTLAFGSQYGIGENNKLVGSLKRTRAILDVVGKACDLPNFHAKIDSASAKNMGDKCCLSPDQCYDKLKLSKDFPFSKEVYVLPYSTKRNLPLRCRKFKNDLPSTKK